MIKAFRNKQRICFFHIIIFLMIESNKNVVYVAAQKKKKWESLSEGENILAKVK